MARTVDPNLKKDILAKCVKAALKKRSLHLSLHEHAKMTGISARMLIYYFGTKAELDDAIVLESDRQLRAEFRQISEATLSEKKSSILEFWDALVADKGFQNLAGLVLNPEIYRNRSGLQDQIEESTADWLDVIQNFVPDPKKAEAVFVVIFGALLDVLVVQNPERGRRALQFII